MDALVPAECLADWFPTSSLRHDLSPTARVVYLLLPPVVHSGRRRKIQFSRTTPVALFAFTLYFSVHSSAFAPTLSTPRALSAWPNVVPLSTSNPPPHTQFNIFSIFYSSHSTVKIWISCRHFPPEENSSNQTAA